MENVESDNTKNLQVILEWLRSTILGHLQVHKKRIANFEAQKLNLHSDDSPVVKMISAWAPTYEEFIIIILSLVPHIKPHFLDQLISEHLPEGGDFPELGGARGKNHRGILPTGETAQFILGGDDLEKRIEVQRILNSEHWFARKHILWLETVNEGEPLMSGRLILDPEIVEQLTKGTVTRPRFSIEFPAEYIETEMIWDDLVLLPETLLKIREIENWIKYNETLMHEWGMKKKVKPGYRVLFYGPPGTGKTLTATLLGKNTGKDVFRIDLSRVVSKYIGETEKNLSKLFDKAENKNWILFFDEADALFGKRTDIRDAHDKYANQEVAYLLQRIEGYNGLVILASNKHGNIDDAFVRRFNSIVYFPMPKSEERYQIWSKTIPDQVKVSKDTDLHQLALRYELSGAEIVNIVHHFCINALSENTLKITNDEILKSIQREFVKSGRIC